MRNIKVVGGVNETHESGEGPSKKVWVDFVPKRTVIVEAKDLAALMRRDAVLCGMPSIRLEETPERPTPGLFFSEFGVR